MTRVGAILNGKKFFENQLHLHVTESKLHFNRMVKRLAFKNSAKLFIVLTVSVNIYPDMITIQNTAGDDDGACKQ